MTRTAEIAKHLRHRLSVEGIKAKCAKIGANEIRIATPAYDVAFSQEDARMIRHIAKCNSLTLVRGLPIDVDQETIPAQFHFYAAA